MKGEGERGEYGGCFTYACVKTMKNLLTLFKGGGRKSNRGGKFDQSILYAYIQLSL
jgi:hypothetical protein